MAIVIDMFPSTMLRTTYATPCEIQAASKIYAYHMVIHRGGNVIIQPEQYLEGRPIFRFNCTGPMISAQFVTLIPEFVTSPPSDVVNRNPSLTSTSFVSSSPVNLPETPDNLSFLDHLASSSYVASPTNEKKEGKNAAHE